VRGHSPPGPGSTKWSVGTCSCGKLSYPTRGQAKKAARHQGGGLRAYAHGSYWHLTSRSHLAIAAYREYDARGGSNDDRAFPDCA